MTSPVNTASHPMYRVETLLMGLSMVLFVLAPTSALFGLPAVVAILGAAWLAVTVALCAAGAKRRRVTADSCTCARCTAMPEAAVPEPVESQARRGIAEIERWLAHRTPSS
jgi:hypothetical protein